MIRGMDETVLKVEERAAPYIEARAAELAVETPAPKKRPVSPLNGQPVPIGRRKGTPNSVTRTLRQAVEMAARDCHPQGLAGWLVERANGSLGDRQIFAAVVQKVIPLQVNTNVQGGISINLNWLGGRNIGTKTAQAEIVDAQVVDAIEHSPSSRWTNDAKPAQDAGPDGQGGQV